METIYQIRPSVDAEPERLTVGVRLIYGPTGAPTFRVGDCYVISVTEHGKINRLHVDPFKAAQAGLELDSHSRVAIFAEPESAAIADAVKAERNHCISVVCDFVSDSDVLMRIAKRIRARGNSDGESA